MSTQSAGTLVNLAAERPRDLVVFYDPLSYAAFDHPYEVYRQLRDHAPVYYNARRDLYVVSRYEDVRACLRNHEQMVNALGNDMDGTHDSYGPGNLIALDQPYHTVLRGVVRPSFAPREIVAMEEHIRALSRDLLAGLRQKGGGDFAQDVALPLVFGVCMRLIGAPESDSIFWQEHLMRSMARTVGQFGIPEDAFSSNREAEEHLDAVVQRRREQIAAGAEADTPDVISQILLAGSKGVQLAEAEEVGLTHLVLSASTDAPAALLTNCIAVLDKFPALQSYLHHNPEMIKNFVEETLRYDGPAKNLCRQTTAEVTIADKTIPNNSRVMVLMGSANRDERIYADPDKFDLFRTLTAENKILTFGEGIHSCMGAPIARLTAQIVVEELVADLHDTEIRVTGTPERWAKQMVRGFASLPVKIVSSMPVVQARKAHASTARIQTVQHRSTRLTLATREFEAPVRVASKQEVAEGVVALTLHELDGRPLPFWEPGSHVDLVLDHAATRQYSLCGDVDDPTAGASESCAIPTAAAAHSTCMTALRPAISSGSAGPATTFRWSTRRATSLSLEESASHRFCRWHGRPTRPDRTGSWCMAEGSGARWPSSTSSLPTATGSPFGRRTKKAFSTSTGCLGSPNPTPRSTAADPSRC